MSRNCPRRQTAPNAPALGVGVGPRRQPVHAGTGFGHYTSASSAATAAAFRAHAERSAQVTPEELQRGFDSAASAFGLTREQALASLGVAPGTNLLTRTAATASKPATDDDAGRDTAAGSAKSVEERDDKIEKEDTSESRKD